METHKIMQNKWINRTEPSEVIKIISIGYGHNFQRTNISLLSWCQYFTYMKPKFCTEIWQDEELLQRILCKLLEAGDVLLSDSLQFHLAAQWMQGNDSVADLGGGGGSRDARPRVPNSFNFMQFSGKFGKIVCWCPPGELAPPPRGNPGSATASDSLNKGKSIQLGKHGFIEVSEHCHEQHITHTESHKNAIVDV